MYDTVLNLTVTFTMTECETILIAWLNISVHRLTMCLSASVVLTAAVTQASLQSMLHKILTAGPSAFNITTILSQAAQLSNQGKWSVSGPPLCADAFSYVCCLMTLSSKMWGNSVGFLYVSWKLNSSGDGSWLVFIIIAGFVGFTDHLFTHIVVSCWVWLK